MKKKGDQKKVELQKSALNFIVLVTARQRTYNQLQAYVLFVKTNYNEKK